MPTKIVIYLCSLFFFSIASCKRIDPNSTLPVLTQLEGTSWEIVDGSNYGLVFKKGTVKIPLGGILGLAETAALVKREHTNFVLASLYEDTPNPFLMAIRIIDKSHIKVYLWEYRTDPSLAEAQRLLENHGRIFKRK